MSAGVPMFNEGRPKDGAKKILCIDRVLATLSLPKLPRMLGGVIVRCSLE